MAPLVYTLQITTLATWLSVLAAGVVGFVVREPAIGLPEGDIKVTPVADIGSVAISDVIANPDSAETSLPNKHSNDLPQTNTSDLPTPPEMAQAETLAPLPEVPAISPKRAIRNAPRTNSAASRKNSSGQQTTRLSGKPAGSSGNRTGMSTAQRLAKGYIPAPAYPASARAKGQSGTVLVEFTIGANGRVTSAYAKKPTPYAALNQAAVAAVRRGRFPPGNVITTRKPIVFQLK